MVTNYSETNQQASPHIPPSANYSHFTEQAPGAGLMGPELGRTQQHFHPYLQPHSRILSLSDPYLQPHFDPLPVSNPYAQPHSLPLSLSNTHLHPHPFSPTHSHEMHEAIQREIEKQRIREEIIMSEILRRRVLEAEIRRELMSERELTLQRGTNGIPVGSSSVVGFESPTRLPVLGTGGEVRSSKERIILSLPEKERLNGRLENRNGGFDTLPFQGCSTDLRFSEVKLVPEGGKEKEEIVLLNTSKPDEDKSGSKRKAVTLPAGPGSSEPSPDSGILRKKTKEWSCAICQVNAPSEITLNEHLNGKKHKSKEASFRAQGAGKNYTIGLYPKIATQPVEGPGAGHLGPSGSPIPLLTENLSADNSKKTQSVVSPTLTENSDNSEKNQSVVVPEEQIKDDLKGNMYSLWCELCQVGVHSQQVMDSHRRGRKHLRRLALSKQKETIILVSGEGEKNVDEAVEEAGPENRDPVDENKAEDD